MALERTRARGGQVLAARQRPARRRDTGARKKSQPTLVKGLHSRSIRSAWRQFNEGSLSHWITTIIIALSLTIYAVFALLLENANTTLEGWRGDDLITVFFKEGADPSQVSAVRERLAARPQVGVIATVPPQEALERLKGRLANEAGLLDELEDNPLPYSIEFKLTPPDPQSGLQAGQESALLAAVILRMPGVEAVSHDRQWAERLSAIVRAFRYGGYVISFLLLGAVALIISNTIKLTIIARQKEVEVMQFMGATDAFIKTPFLYEGILQGLLGAMLSMGITVVLHMGAQEISRDLGAAFGVSLSLHFLPMWQVGFILGLGVFLGLAGALISISRFLEV